jgi:hypothetical protein
MNDQSVDEDVIIACYNRVCFENPRITDWWALVMAAERAGCDPMDVADAVQRNVE